ncbi:IclR family transcriptional regulator [Cupriavidus lacunae]|uniref:IclR family transcriptional regulator n=1 Tax=Cupriavidus lacunae TaxID=2666307 RepID=UPI000F0BCC13|nr:helix-turn-helix domain-containing protein [Cupriavidus lacunae]
MTSTARDQGLVKSAARVLSVLEFFDQIQREASVAEVADRHGWPHSSTSVLMRSLVTLGYLHYDASSRTYVPSMRVALLGDWLKVTPALHGELLQLLRHLNESTGETIVLAAQNGLHTQYVRVLQGTNVVRTHLHIGTRRPMLNPGTGRMLLTAMDDASIRKHNALKEAPGPMEEDAVFKRLAEDRRRGYALSMHQVTQYSGVISMLLPAVEGAQPLAIGIATLSQQLVDREDHYAQVLRDSIHRFMNSTEENP